MSFQRATRLKWLCWAVVRPPLAVPPSSLGLATPTSQCLRSTTTSVVSGELPWRCGLHGLGKVKKSFLCCCFFFVVVFFVFFVVVVQQVDR